jgi:hypothetical protein
MDAVLIDREIRRLISELPAQKAIALRVLVRLRARGAARITNLTELSRLLSDLPEGDRGIFAQTRRLRELAEEIQQQQRRVDATNRSYFREIETRNLISQIKGFQGAVSGMREPLASDFLRAAEAW